jgi:hypothetical protein
MKSICLTRTDPCIDTHASNNPIPLLFVCIRGHAPPSSMNSIHVWSPKGLGRTNLVATCRLRTARRSRMPASTCGEETLVPAFSPRSTLGPALKAFRRRVPKDLPPNVIFPQ